MARILGTISRNGDEKMTHPEGKFCACGSPQAYPIPHIHDMTDREKRIYDAMDKQLVEVQKSKAWWMERASGLEKNMWADDRRIKNLEWKWKEAQKAQKVLEQLRMFLKDSNETAKKYVDEDVFEIILNAIDIFEKAVQP